MCHGAAVKAFPSPSESTPFERTVQGYRFANEAGHRVAVLPDIYGCNDFYRGLATLLQQKGADVWLVDTFADFGDLPEMTREAAFERRHKVADKDFVDRFEAFIKESRIKSVIGFCLGGFYVFELARRNIDATLLGLYGFPQGMANKDPLPAPFDYLESVEKPFGMLMGESDESVGPEHIARLGEMDASAPAMDLKIYPGVGHNFLPLLDEKDDALRGIAQDALTRIEQAALA